MAMKRPGLAACSVSIVLVILLPLSASASSTSLPTGINLLTTERLYTPGETVRVLGQIYTYSGAIPMLITVYAPDQKTVLSHTINNAQQVIDFTFTLDPRESRMGQWKVVAIYSDQRAETTFTLMSKSGFHQIILEKPTLQDSAGNRLEPEKQKAGQLMTISADVVSDEDDKSQQFVFIVQVLDSANMPAQISLVFGSVDAGMTSSPMVTWAPKTAGTYTVEVFVWNSLSSPVPLAEKQAGTFEILA